MPAPFAAYQDITTGPGQVRIEGSFATNGASAVSDVKGKGFTVARTGVGVYEVTLGPSTSLPTPFRSLICGLVGRQGAAGTNTLPQISAVDVTSATAPKITITNQPGGVATELAAGNRVNFSFVLATSELNS